MMIITCLILVVMYKMLQLLYDFGFLRLLSTLSVGALNILTVSLAEF